jgi:hypothetical protein
VFTWRRQVRTGKLAARHTPLFLPVQAHEASRPTTPARPGRAGDASRDIEIELANGSRVRVGEGVSLPALRRVLAALRG